MHEHQTALYNWISHWFYIAPPVWDALSHPHIHTHKSTHRPLRCVITTLLWLYKMACKYKPASQLAPLTFSLLSSPLPSFPSPCFFHLDNSVLSAFIFPSLFTCLCRVVSTFLLLFAPPFFFCFSLFHFSFISLYSSHNLNTTSEQDLHCCLASL